jgi:hypothetical protein
MLCCISLAFFLACSDDDAQTGPAGKPDGLVVVGSLGRITVSWNRPSGEVTNYRVLRSTDNVTYDVLGHTNSRSYVDLIPSPAGDGIKYWYRVIALGTNMSDASEPVSSMHGTRMAASYASGHTNTVALSPWVLEGTTIINGGSLVIPTGAKLYALPGSVLDMEHGRGIVVSGQLQLLGEQSHNVVVRGHSSPASEGYYGYTFSLYNSPAWTGVPGVGTLFRHALITNVGSGMQFSGEALCISNCRIYNRYGAGSMRVGPNIPAGSVVTRSYFYAFVPHLGANMIGSGYRMTLNRFVAGSWAFSVAYQGFTVSSGQVVSNWFDGSVAAYMATVTEDVHLEGNFWDGGTNSPPVPPLYLYESDNKYVFSDALAAVPNMCGPTW